MQREIIDKQPIPQQMPQTYQKHMGGSHIEIGLHKQLEAKSDGHLKRLGSVICPEVSGEIITFQCSALKLFGGGEIKL
jgi:hypothetical protein